MNSRRRFLLSALALPVVAYAGQAFALARWQYYNRDPAYPTRAAALADAERVFIRAGWPRGAASQMAAKMRREAGEPISLVNGDRLDFMRTGARGMWVDVLVDFQPVSMRIEALSERWVIEFGGETFEAILPRVCNNLSGRRHRRPQELAGCAYIVFEAREGDESAAVAVLGEFAEDPNCQVSYAGPGTGPSGRTFAPEAFRPLAQCSTLAPCDWTTVVNYYRQTLGPNGTFRVTPGWWVVKIPRRVAQNPNSRVVICLKKASGLTTLSMGVQHFDYVPAGNRLIATIWYSEADIPASYREARRTNLWWRWPAPVRTLGG